MAALLDEPQIEADRRAADEALLHALHVRATLGPAPSPDAEAIALRQLLDAAPDSASLEFLRTIWSRLDASARPSLAVHGSEAALFAADRFGLNLRLTDSPEAALSAVSGRARALIEIGQRPWWGKLLARPDLSIVAAFPDQKHARPRALMLSAERPGPTGDDRTFWITDSPLPDGKIIEALGALGLAAEPLAASGGLKLFQLAGYVQADDGRLTDAPGQLTGVIGAAPIY